MTLACSRRKHVCKSSSSVLYSSFHVLCTASRVSSSFILFLFTVISCLQWTAMVDAVLVPCPSSALAVTMLSHFPSPTNSLTFTGCDFVYPVQLQDLSSVSVVFTSSTFHLGQGNVVVLGNNQNVSFSIVNSTVIRWWMLTVPTALDPQSRTLLEDTCSSPSLFDVDGITTGNPASINGMQLQIVNVSWSAQCANDTSVFKPLSLATYFQQGPWRTSSSLLSEAWAGYLFRSLGIVTITNAAFVLSSVVATHLVGTLPGVIAFNDATQTLTDLSLPSTMLSACQSTQGLPIVTNAHVMFFGRTSVLSTSNVWISDCFFDFGGVKNTSLGYPRYADGGVVPGGNASVIMWLPNPSSTLFIQRVSISIQHLMFYASVTLLPPHDNVPYRYQPRLQNQLSVNGTSVSSDIMLLSSYLSVVIALGGGTFSDPSGSKLYISLRSSFVQCGNTLSLDGLNSTMRKRPVWLNTSSGFDIVASVLVLGRFSGSTTWDGLGLTVSNCVMEFRSALTVALSKQLALYLNATSNSRFFELVGVQGNYYNNASVISALVASFYGSVWTVAALGGDGLHNGFLTLTQSWVGCRSGCHALNLTVADVNNVEFGRMVPNLVSSSASTSVNNVSMTMREVTVETFLEPGSVQISSFIGSNASVPCLTFSHRVLRCSPAMLHNRQSPPAQTMLTLHSMFVNVMMPLLSSDSPVGVLAICVTCGGRSSFQSSALNAILYPPDGALGAAHQRGALTLWAAVVDVTSHDAYSVVLDVANSTFAHCGWAQDCFRFDNQNINPQSAVPAVKDLVFNFSFSSMQCYGWQSRCIALLNHGFNQVDDTRLRLEMRYASATHLFVTPLSGARTVMLGGMLGPPPTKQGVTLFMWQTNLSMIVECEQQHRVTSAVLSNMSANASVLPSARYVSAPLSIVNQTLKGVEVAFPSSVIIDQCAISILLASSTCSPGLCSLQHDMYLQQQQQQSLFGQGCVIALGASSPLALERSNSSALLASIALSGDSLVTLPSSWAAMSSAILLDSTVLTTSMHVNVTRTSITGIGVPLELSPSTTLSSNSLVYMGLGDIAVVNNENNTSSTPIEWTVECIAFRNRSSAAAGMGISSFVGETPYYSSLVPHWNSSLWCRCASLLLLSSSVQSSLVMVQSASLSNRISIKDIQTTETMLPSSCDLTTLSASAVILAGTWISSELAISAVKILVDGFHGVQPPSIGGGEVAVTRAFGIRSFSVHELRTNVVNSNTAVASGRGAVWTATQSFVTVTQSSNITVVSYLGPATAVYVPDSLLNKFTLRVNVYPIFPNMFITHVIDNVTSWQEYVSWYPPTTIISATSFYRMPRRVSGGFSSSNYGVICPMTDSVTANSDPATWRIVQYAPTWTTGARLLWIADGTLVISSLFNFTDVTMSARTQLVSDEGFHPDTTAWSSSVVNATRSNMTTLPMILAVTLLQSLTSGGLFVGGIVGMSPLNLSSTVALEITFEVSRSTMETTCDTQPLLMFNNASSAVSPLAGVVSLSDIRCSVANVAFGNYADAAVVNITVAKNTSLTSAVVTGGLGILGIIADTGSSSMESLVVNATVGLGLFRSGRSPDVCPLDVWWLYVPPAVGRATLITGGGGSSCSDLFAATSSAVNVEFFSRFNASASSTLGVAVALSPSAANATKNETVTFDSVKIRALSATIVEASSSANLAIRGNGQLQARSWFLSANQSLLSSQVTLIPVLRLNTSIYDATTESNICSNVITAAIAATTTECVCGGQQPSSLATEPAATNLLFDSPKFSKLSISWTNNSIESVVSPALVSGVAMTLVSPDFYRNNRSSLYPPWNATLQVSQAFARHARNIHFSGNYLIANWPKFSVTDSSGVMTAEVYTGMDGHAQNIVLEGNGQVNNVTSNVWGFRGLSGTLRALGSHRGIPFARNITETACNITTTLSSGPSQSVRQSVNVALRGNFSSSYQTITATGLTLQCRGYCTNLDIGNAQLNASSSSRSVWLGSRMAMQGINFHSASSKTVFLGLSDSDSPQGTTKSFIRNVWNIPNLTAVVYTPTITALLPSQQRDYPNANLVLRPIGGYNTITMDGTSFYSSGVNVVVSPGTFPCVVLSVTSRTGFLSNPVYPPGSPWEDVGDNTYSNITGSVNVPAVSSCATLIPRTQTGSPAMMDRGTSWSSRGAPFFSNVVVANSMFDGPGAGVFVKGQVVDIGSSGQVVPSNPFETTVSTSQISFCSRSAFMVDIFNVLVTASAFSNGASVLIGDALGASTSSMPFGMIARVLAHGSSGNALLDSASEVVISTVNVLVMKTSFIASLLRVSAPRLQMLSLMDWKNSSLMISRSYAHNVFLSGVTFNGSDTVPFGSPFVGVDGDVLGLSADDLASRGFVFGTLQYQTGVFVTGIEAMRSISPLTNATNFFAVDTTLHRAALHLSASVLFTSRVVPATAVMSVATTFGIASNIVFDGASTLDNISAVVLQGFAGVYTSYNWSMGKWTFPLGDNANPTAAVGGWVERGMLNSVSGVNLYFGSTVDLISVRLHVASTTLLSNVSNMLSLSDGGSWTANVTLCFTQQSNLVLSPADISPLSSQATTFLQATTVNVLLLYRLVSVVPFLNGAYPPVVAGQLRFFVEQSSVMSVFSTRSKCIDHETIANVAYTMLPWDATTNGNSSSLYFRRPPCFVANRVTFDVSTSSRLSSFSDSICDGTVANIWLNHLDSSIQSMNGSTMRMFDSASLFSYTLWSSEYCGANTYGSPMEAAITFKNNASCTASRTASTTKGALITPDETRSTINVCLGVFAKAWRLWNVTLHIYNRSMLSSMGDGVANTFAFRQDTISAWEDSSLGNRSDILAPNASWLLSMTGPFSFFMDTPPRVSVSMTLLNFSNCSSSATRHARNILIVGANGSHFSRSAAGVHIFVSVAVSYFSRLDSTVAASFAAQDTPVALDQSVFGGPITDEGVLPETHALSAKPIDIVVVENWLLWELATVTNTTSVFASNSTAQTVTVNLFVSQNAWVSALVSGFDAFASVSFLDSLITASVLVLHESIISISRYWLVGASSILRNASTALRPISPAATVIVTVDAFSVVSLSSSIVAPLSFSSIATVDGSALGCVPNTSSAYFSSLCESRQLSRQHLHLVSIQDFIEPQLVTQRNTSNSNRLMPLRRVFGSRSTTVSVEVSYHSTVESVMNISGGDGSCPWRPDMWSSPKRIRSHLDLATFSASDHWLPSPSEANCTLDADAGRGVVIPLSSELQDSFDVQLVASDSSTVRVRLFSNASSQQCMQEGYATVSLLSQAPFIRSPWSAFFDGVSMLRQATSQATQLPSCNATFSSFGAGRSYVKPSTIIRFSAQLESESTLRIEDVIGSRSTWTRQVLINTDVTVASIIGRDAPGNASSDDVTKEDAFQWFRSGAFTVPITATDTLFHESKLVLEVSNASRVTLIQESTADSFSVGLSLQSFTPSALSVFRMVDVTTAASVLLHVRNDSSLDVYRPLFGTLLSPLSAAYASHPHTALLGCSRCTVVQKMTLIIDDGSTITAHDRGLIGIALDEVDVIGNISSIVMDSTLLGAWETFFLYRRLSNASVGFMRNVEVAFSLCPALQFSSSPITLPANNPLSITNSTWTFTQSSLQVSPFGSQSSSVIAFVLHPWLPPDASISSAPSIQTSVAVSSSTFIFDNMTLQGVGAVFNPSCASVFTTNGTNVAANATSLLNHILVAGGSWIIDGHAGRWPAMAVGLPTDLLSQIMTTYNTSLWNHLPLQVLPYEPYTTSVSNSESNPSSATQSHGSPTIRESATLSVSTMPTKSVSTSHSTSLTTSTSVTPSVSVASATPTTTVFLRPCPTIVVTTLPPGLSDSDIATDTTVKYLVLTLQVSPESTDTFTWSRNVGSYVTFMLVTGYGRAEVHGFDRELKALLLNASQQQQWQATDTSFQSMQLPIPTAPKYQLNGAETVRILLTPLSVSGGCLPSGAAAGTNTTALIGMQGTFVIGSSVSTMLPTVSAIVAVIGSSLGVAIGFGGMMSAFLTVQDLQVLALLGTMSCAMPNQVQFGQYMVYLLSPFAGLSATWIALGGLILCLGTFVAHAILAFTWSVAKGAESMDYGRIRVRFPGLSIVLSSFLLPGIVAGSFRAARGDETTPPSVGSALGGIAFATLFFAYLGNLLFRETKPLLDFRPYPPQPRPVTMVLSWFQASGQWMSSKRPYDLHDKYSAALGYVRDGCKIAVLLAHLQMIIVAVLSSYRFADDACYVQYATMLGLQLPFVIFYVVVRPFRFPIANATMIVSQLGVIAALASNIAYALNPHPFFADIQTGVQLGVSVVAIFKLVVLAVVVGLDQWYFVHPSSGPTPDPIPPPSTAAINAIPPPALVEIVTKVDQDPFDVTDSHDFQRGHKNSDFSDSSVSSNDSDVHLTVSDAAFEPSHRNADGSKGYVINDDDL